MKGWNATAFVVCVIHGQPKGLESYKVMLLSDLCLVWLHFWEERFFSFIYFLQIFQNLEPYELFWSCIFEKKVFFLTYKNLSMSKISSLFEYFYNRNVFLREEFITSITKLVKLFKLYILISLAELIQIMFTD